MPRRVNDVLHLAVPPKKKLKVEELPPSLDVSFFDDEALPPGIVFSDLQEKKWRLGKPIGRGSFGRIYLASDDVDDEVTKGNARYVVKIEPHTNGPLFVEVHCLIRTAQVDKVKAWHQKNKQKLLGMPVYIASGSFTDENTGVKYRFLVLPRYDIDLQKIIARTKVLDLKNVLVLAVQILDVLEYLHNQGYTHSDIKSSNLMLGFDGGKFTVSPVKPALSFEKETKVVAVLSGKQRRAKSGKSRASKYYDDEDFTVKSRSGNNSEEEDDNRLKKLRKILSDRESRTLHRHHAFNLRQLSNNVNYEEFNSSVCSDQSYQKLLDDFGNFAHSKFNGNTDLYHSEFSLDKIHKEAVLSQSNGQIYLLDYGLASKFLDSQGNHKVFAMDARKAHDGTLEYSSRDSHIGAHSRRSDLETLGYNLLDWMTGSLPWKTTEVLAEPDLVHALKKNFMSDIKTILKTCFKTEFYPQFMEKYLEYVTSLEFTDTPDYDYCRSLFKGELLKNGYDKNIRLSFAEPQKSSMSRKLCLSKRFGRMGTPDFLVRNGIKKAYERENVCSLENDHKLELLKPTSDGFRKPCVSKNFYTNDANLIARLKKTLLPHDILFKKLSPKNLRSKNKIVGKRRDVRKHRNSIGKFGKFMGSNRQFTWAEILAGNPEDIIRKERNATVTDNVEGDEDEGNCKYRIRKLSNTSSDSGESNLQSPLMLKDYLQTTPTYAMKEIIANFKKKVTGKSTKENEESTEGLEGYTPAMVKVFRIKEKREAKERLEAIKQNNLPIKEPVVFAVRCTRSKIQNMKNPKLRTQKIKQKSKEEVEKVEDAKKAKVNENPSKISKQKTQDKKIVSNTNVETPKLTRRSTRTKTGKDKKHTETKAKIANTNEKVPTVDTTVNLNSSTDKTNKSSSKTKAKPASVASKKETETNLNKPTKATNKKASGKVVAHLQINKSNGRSKVGETEMITIENKPASASKKESLRGKSASYSPPLNNRRKLRSGNRKKQ